MARLNPFKCSLPDRAEHGDSNRQEPPQYRHLRRHRTRAGFAGRQELAVHRRPRDRRGSSRCNPATAHDLVRLDALTWRRRHDAQGEALPYKNFYGDTGIALDVDKRELHLYQKPHYVVYPLDKIRSWSTNVQTGGNVYGTGLAVAAGNIGTAIANNKATGLFIEAKDIDHPKWRIVFSGRGRDREMARWMEILNQHVNEDR